MNGMVQMPLKHRQTWSINHVSRKPVPTFDNTLPKKSFLMSKSKPPPAQLSTIPTHPVPLVLHQVLFQSPAAQSCSSTEHGKKETPETNQSQTTK